MADTNDHLKDMITNLIDDNVDAARVNFHDALKAKMQVKLNPELAAAPVEEEDDETEEVLDDEEPTE